VRAAETYSIFLAGPYIKIDENIDHPENNKSLASTLRYFLYFALEEVGHVIYLGEDVELRNNGEKHYGSLANAVVYERHYIINHIDAVIALPSSPGSFCELGDWVSDERICKHMLVIIDKKYEGKTNYINEGVVKFAYRNHATIVYHSYEDQQGILSLCEQFMEEVAQRMRVEKLYGRA